MTRLLVWLLLVGISVASVVGAHFQVAILLGALKALLVGVEFMELRHAARAHAVLYVAFIALITIAVSIAAS